MDLGMQLGQGQRLEQTLSPQLLQSVAILQKTSMELETAIKEEVEANPLLELDESYSDEVSYEDVAAEAERKENPGNSDDEANLDASLDPRDYERGDLEDSASIDRGMLDGATNAELDWGSYLNDGYSDTDAPFKDLNASQKDSDEEWDRPIKDVDLSLQDKLKNQLREWNGTRELQEQLREAGCSDNRFRKLVEHLINSLDENGFVQGSQFLNAAVLEQFANSMAKETDNFIVEIESVLSKAQNLEMASLPVREAFHVLQSFKPRGIGARDLRECFLIQAYAIPDFPELAIRILEDHFEDLNALRYAKIAKDVGVSTDSVQQTVSSLSRLTPHPGLQISSGTTQIRAADMRVVEKKGRLEVEVIRSKNQKSLRVNRMYADMLKNKALPKSDRDYITEKLKRAKEFMSAIDNRYSTMELVMRAIVKRQKDFFEKGPSALRPMVLQEIADDVGRDVSTVNRVTNGKYVETPFGLRELKDFFTSGVRQGESSDADVVGSAQILDAIKGLVEAENKKKPLSDQAIADKLMEQGIKVARRTVAKYREEELKILPARLRKIV